jgi:hypothetical protein
VSKRGLFHDPFGGNSPKKKPWPCWRMTLGLFLVAETDHISNYIIISDIIEVIDFIDFLQEGDFFK